MLRPFPPIVPLLMTVCGLKFSCEVALELAALPKLARADAWARLPRRRSRLRVGSSAESSLSSSTRLNSYMVGIPFLCGSVWLGRPTAGVHGALCDALWSSHGESVTGCAVQWFVVAELMLSLTVTVRQSAI